MGQIAPFNSPRLRASARTFSFGSEITGNRSSASWRFNSSSPGNLGRHPSGKPRTAIDSAMARWHDGHWSFPVTDDRRR
jgi:hypothetical protein